MIDPIHAAINHHHDAADRRRTHATDVNMTRPDVCVCLIFHGLSRWDEAANDQGRREDEAQGGRKYMSWCKVVKGEMFFLFLKGCKIVIQQFARHVKHTCVSAWQERKKRLEQNTIRHVEDIAVCVKSRVDDAI